LEPVKARPRRPTTPHPAIVPRLVDALIAKSRARVREGSIMRSLMLAASTAVLLLASAAPSALADTAAQTANTFVYGASFSFVDHGQTWSGIGQIEDDRLHGVQFASFFFRGSGADKVCDAGTPEDPTDDYTGNDYIEFDPTSTRLTDSSVRSDLAAAKFAMTVIGLRYRFDACTGELIEARHEHHSFAMALKATAEIQTESNSILIDNGDGTFSPGTETFSFRTAGGKASVDSISASVSDGLIQHVVISRN
jgi:hypothetical protein